MVEYTLEFDSLIGMVQPYSQEEEALHEIGCLGKIEHCQKKPNGHYMIQLHGEIRFRMVKELETDTMFRQAQVDYSSYHHDLEKPRVDREIQQLHQAFRDYTKSKTLHVEWDKIKTIPVHYLVNILCMNLEFNPMEKQALLEAEDLNSRWDDLISLMQMLVAEEGLAHPSSSFIN